MCTSVIASLSLNASTDPQKTIEKSQMSQGKKGQIKK